MILREIYIYPDLVEYPISVTGRFRDESRHICNFLERKISSLSFDSAGYKKICVIGVGGGIGKPQVNSSGALLAPVEFSLDCYLGTSGCERSAYIGSLLKEGFIRASESFALPIEHLIQGLDELKQSGYVNQWVFKSKKSKGLGVVAELICVLTIDEFKLFLKIHRGVNFIEHLVLKTVPDEIVFKKKFRDVRFFGGEVQVVDANNEIVFQCAVSGS